jgi:hypothetical protein
LTVVYLLTAAPVLAQAPPDHLLTAQALDSHSTWHALGRGAREANPLVERLAEKPAAMVALKAGSTAAVICATEKLWKRNRAAAVLTMIGLNTAYAVVVSHNYAVAR